MDELNNCIKYHDGKGFEDLCCSHIREVLAEMQRQGIEPDGDTQVCGLRCKKCDRFHGF